jgi:hypothetical protein
VAELLESSKGFTSTCWMVCGLWVAAWMSCLLHFSVYLEVHSSNLGKDTFSL